MRPSRRNHVVITLIEFLPSAKNLLLVNANLGLGKPKAALALEQKYILFRGIIVARSSE